MPEASAAGAETSAASGLTRIIDDRVHRNRAHFLIQWSHGAEPSWEGVATLPSEALGSYMKAKMLEKEADEGAKSEEPPKRKRE